MFELVNTSLPNGLLPGTHGFATVAMTRGLADNLRRRLEDLSAYVHKTSAHDATYTTLNPVAWSHLILPRGEHVLGRVAASPFDYTGRTNRLARLVCLTAAEAKSFNAAETLLRENAYFSAPWEGEARWLESNAALSTRFTSPSTRASRKSQTWIDAFGEADGSRYAAGFAAMLRDAIRQNGRPLTFVTSQQSDRDGRHSLAFIADLIALLPETLQPSATFSTYPCAIPIGVKCAIRILRKDDNGYAQAVAGVPVADFAAKTVQSANLLPNDAELELLAATGNLPAPVAPVKVAPQTTTALQSVTVKAATDEAIDVSFDLPSATEASGAIAVTEKDASHRKPKLKQHSGQSAPMPVQGQQFDPLFGQPRKRSNGLLIAAVAGAAVLLLGLAVFIVLQSRPKGSISGSDTSVQTAQDAERTRIKEQFERERAEVLRKEAEERQRREAEEAAAKAKAEQAERDRLAREAAAKAAKPVVTDAAQSGKAEPIYAGITNIVLCKNDDEAKSKFGKQKKSGLCTASVWYYSGKGFNKFTFTDKPDSKGGWYSIIGEDSLYELDPKMPDEKNTPYCRIWYFDKKPKTLFWITGNDGSAEFELSPPHNNTPVNLADRLTGPDLRVLAQWEAYFGEVSCQAWSAEGTNRVEWQEVDAGAFVPSAFIAQCHRLRLSAQNAALTAATNDEKRIKSENSAAIKAKQDELNQLKAKLQAEGKDVEAAFADVEKKYKDATNELAKAEAALQSAESAVRQAQNDVREVKADKTVKGRQGRIHDAEKKLNDAKGKVQPARQDRDRAQLKFDVVKQKYESAQRRHEKEKTVKAPRLSALEGEIERLKKAPAKAQKTISDLNVEIMEFPTVAEAQRQWTIHVKVNLGGGK